MGGFRGGGWRSNSPNSKMGMVRPTFGSTAELGVHRPISDLEWVGGVCNIPAEKRRSWCPSEWWIFGRSLKRAASLYHPLSSIILSFQTVELGSFRRNSAILLRYPAAVLGPRCAELWTVDSCSIHQSVHHLTELTARFGFESVMESDSGAEHPIPIEAGSQGCTHKLGLSVGAAQGLWPTEEASTCISRPCWPPHH